MLDSKMGGGCTPTADPISPGDDLSPAFHLTRAQSDVCLVTDTVSCRWEYWYSTPILQLERRHIYAAAGSLHTVPSYQPQSLL
jgi:hypothetical protein